jgi:hypothetical protein
VNWNCHNRHRPLRATLCKRYLVSQISVDCKSICSRNSAYTQPSRWDLTQRLIVPPCKAQFHFWRWRMKFVYRGTIHRVYIDWVNFSPSELRTTRVLGGR